MRRAFEPALHYTMATPWGKNSLAEILNPIWNCSVETPKEAHCRECPPELAEASRVPRKSNTAIDSHTIRMESRRTRVAPETE